VDGGARAGAHLLAVEEHGRLVLLALADHHPAVHLHRADERTHGVDRRARATDLVATSHPAAGGERGGPWDSGELRGGVSVGTLGVGHVASAASFSSAQRDSARGSGGVCTSFFHVGGPVAARASGAPGEGWIVAAVA